MEVTVHSLYIFRFGSPKSQKYTVYTLWYLDLQVLRNMSLIGLVCQGNACWVVKHALPQLSNVEAGC